MTPAPTPKINHRRENLNVAQMLEWVRGSYWSSSYATDESFKRACHNSLIFGAYQRDSNTQIGFVRIVSDHAANSMITDCYVAEAHRRQGVGTALMTAAIEHSSVARTICILQARAENLLWYARFGFVPVGGPIMKRNPTK